MVYVAGLLVVVALAGVVAWRLLDTASRYEQALGTLPRSTLRTTYTDWAEVRTSARGSGLGASASEAQVEAFLTRAYDLDLTSGSAVAESTYALQDKLGFSPLHTDWETFGQGKDGQVDVLRVDDSVDLAAVERRLKSLGYTPPRAGSGTGGTWVGGSDLVAQIDPDLTPVQQNVAVLADQHLVVMSDNAAYLSASTSVVKGSDPALTEDAGVSSLAQAAGDPVAATQWTSTFACEDLSMGSADEGDQRVGDQLVAEAGRVSPLAGLVMAQQADRSIVFGLHFETSEQASANLQPRGDLATGDAPGQGGSFSERFTLESGRADGHDVVLTTERTPRNASVLSDLTSGPVLFATC
ncbi:hypothetical protein BH10ACT10_BH10ACT10_23510 [soil metagenome]